MTHKTETALDLDGLAASGFTEGPWRCDAEYEYIVSDAGDDVVSLGIASREDVELAAAAPSLLSLAISQDARIRELTERLKELDALLNASEIRLSQKQGLADADAHAARRLNIHQ